MERNDERDAPCRGCNARPKDGIRTAVLFVPACARGNGHVAAMNRSLAQSGTPRYLEVRADSLTRSGSPRRR